MSDLDLRGLVKVIYLAIALGGNWGSIEDMVVVGIDGCLDGANDDKEFEVLMTWTILSFVAVLFEESETL